MSEVKINWDATLTNFDDQQLKKNASPDSEDATLRYLVCQAMDAQLPIDQGLKKGEKKDRRYLMKRIKRPEGPGQLSNTDTDLIKDRLEAIYSPWVLGQCLDLLDGNPGDEPAKKVEP